MALKTSVWPWILLANSIVVDWTKNAVKIQIGPDHQAAVATITPASWMLCPVSWSDWNQIKISN